MSDLVLPPQERIEVAEGIVAIVQGRGEAGVSNSSVVVEDGRALVVDAMLLPEMSAGPADVVAGMGAQAQLVLATHHHLDHVGGSSTFPEARFVAHPEAVGIVTEMVSDMDRFDRLMPRFAGRFADLEVRIPEPLDGEPPPLPLGAALLVLGPAHTPVDLAVWLADQRVLLAGDLCFNGVTPLVIHGSLGGWMAALDTLVRLDPEVVVPGHGPLASVGELLALRDYLDRVLRTGRAAAAAGATAAEAAADFDPGPAGSWLETERTGQNLARAIDECREG